MDAPRIDSGLCESTPDIPSIILWSKDMDYTGIVVDIKTGLERNPSVLVRAHHDEELVGWFEFKRSAECNWQTDLRGGKELKIEDCVRCRLNAPIKICF